MSNFLLEGLNVSFVTLLGEDSQKLEPAFLQTSLASFPFVILLLYPITVINLRCKHDYVLESFSSQPVNLGEVCLGNL